MGIAVFINKNEPAFINTSPYEKNACFAVSSVHLATSSQRALRTNYLPSQPRKPMLPRSSPPTSKTCGGGGGGGGDGGGDGGGGGDSRGWWAGVKVVVAVGGAR